MKNIYFLILSTFSNTLFGQVYFNYTRNLDFYKPYTSLTQEYMKTNDKIYSHTQSLSLRFRVKEREKYTWDIGFVYKRIHHLVDDKVLGYYKHYYSPSGGLDYYYLVDEKLDLVSVSNAFGFISQFDHVLLERNNFCHKIGFSNEIYLFENYSSIYRMESGADVRDEIADLNISPLNSSFGTKIFLSYVSLSANYLFQFQANEKLSLGTKISLGTNLYSDWDQFKKYAWLGVGLEVGFGKKKVKEIKD